MDKIEALVRDYDIVFITAGMGGGTGTGTVPVVAEAARNVACSGARPIGITNCLNFGNPYKPESFYFFQEAVAGMGGLGKTQLAVEFAYRHGKYMRGVYWLNLADISLFESEVAACGKETAGGERDAAAPRRRDGGSYTGGTPTHDQYIAFYDRLSH